MIVSSRLNLGHKILVSCKRMEHAKTKIFFPNLDGLRSIAFLVVFINHAFGSLAYNNTNKGFIFIRNHYLRSGDLGVNLFFVLSGFLITYLLLKEKALNGCINIPHFYLRRILRIWPVYFFVVGLCLFVIPLFNSNIPAHFPISVTTNKLNPWLYAGFLGNFDYIYHGITNVMIGVLWSVSVEEQFYLFWPVLIALLPKKYLPFSFISIILGAIAFRLFGSHGGNAMLLKYHSLSSMSDLATGALLAYFCTKESFLAKIQNTPKWLIASIYLLFLVLIPFRQYTWKLGTHYVQAAAVVPLLFSCFFAFFIVEQNYARHSFYKMSRIRILSSLGKFTYGMYCYHMLIFFLVLYTFYIAGINVMNPNKFIFILEILVSISCTVLFAKWSYQYVEKGFLNLKDKFSSITKG